ncbi:TetR family transcriptional regulator [Ktedonobacter sp. SOSP1-52]|uniref:TetR/AcrR family transcriptional regulator n=1 Tax=Ktedonobacter sp. SOSP1-52 TaxID=2778366 RepID=UPI00191635B4|nr:TetR/AcrR family transcriptional regulator [Ktedonobacter sp. SOSP1-52]GHO61841.1 TetR family transcriptional regulator [Ktedonobacter sp. SOSP1-52]
MAGKKAFQPEQALQQAMDLFWERGYEGSSVEDLVAHTGIGRGSLYDTFGDKHSLYLAALDRYCAQNQGQIEAFRQQSGPLREVLASIFQTYIDMLLNDPKHRGCFLVNSSVELAPHDPDVRTRVQAAYKVMEEAFYRLLIKAQAAGELAWTYDPHQFAHFLLGALISIRVLARANVEREVLQNIARTTLSVFD